MFLRVILIIFSCYGRLSLSEFLKQLTMLELSIKCKLKSGLVWFSLVKSGGLTWPPLVSLGPPPNLHICFLVFRFVSFWVIFLRFICNVCLSVFQLCRKFESGTKKGFYICLCSFFCT